MEGGTSLPSRKKRGVDDGAREKSNLSPATRRRMRCKTVPEKKEEDGAEADKEDGGDAAKDDKAGTERRKMRKLSSLQVCPAESNMKMVPAEAVSYTHLTLPTKSTV